MDDVDVISDRINIFYIPNGYCELEQELIHLERQFDIVWNEMPCLVTYQLAVELLRLLCIPYGFCVALIFRTAVCFCW